MSLSQKYICLLLFFTPFCWAAKTYVLLADSDIYQTPNGVLLETWSSGTVFTSAEEDTLWIKITGHITESGWQPLRPVRYVKQSDSVRQRQTKYKNSPASVIYQTLKSRPATAKAYRLLESITAYYQPPSKTAPDEQQLVELESGYTFTSGYQNEDEIKITGHFPEGKWQPVNPAIWIKKPARLQDRSKPTPYFRAPNSKRFAVVDKNKFELVVYEVTDGKQQKILKTPVALGYDRCLSADKGGKCYYTPEGQYQIDFKLFDADGINWCVPKKMEMEYKDRIARGERCWRGIMGNHALHFGNSLFLHGTSSPNSIGSRSTHGCVRLRNEDIAMVYRLLDKGDQVLISAEPETFDLVKLAQERQAPIALGVKTEKQAIITLVDDIP